MAIVAVTRIKHGEADGSVKEIGVGDNVTGLDEDQQRQLVESGAAIETGKSRKWNSPYGSPAAESVEAPGDEETRKRDELIEKARLGSVEDDKKAQEKRQG